MENLIFLNVQQSIQKVWFEFKNQKRIKEERSEGNGDGEKEEEKKSHLIQLNVILFAAAICSPFSLTSNNIIAKKFFVYFFSNK